MTKLSIYSVFLLSLIISSLCDSQDFRLELSLPKTEFISAEPIVVTAKISNISGREQRLIFGEKGFVTYFHVERLDGLPRKECPREIISAAEHKIRSIKADWSETKVQDITQTELCGDGPGNYKIRFIVASEAQNVLDTYGNVWVGRNESSPLFFTIKEPTGVDKDAFVEFNGDPLRGEFRGKLLLKYPTSLYAAYVVYRSAGIEGADPAQILAQIENGSYFGGPLPDDTGKSPTGWRYLSPHEEIAWREKWLTTVQTQHPDIWFSDHLKLRKVMDNLATKNYDIAAGELKSIAGKGNVHLRETSLKYLSLLKEKGLLRE
jgi:hypothetical protein